MKEYKPRYEELHKYYQVWLTDSTKLTVRSGMCHQNIYHHHTLTVAVSSSRERKRLLPSFPSACIELFMAELQHL